MLIDSFSGLMSTLIHEKHTGSGRNAIGEIVPTILNISFDGIIFHAKPDERMMWKDKIVNDTLAILRTKYAGIAYWDGIKMGWTIYRVLGINVVRDIDGSIDHHKYYLTHTK